MQQYMDYSGRLAINALGPPWFLDGNLCLWQVHNAVLERTLALALYCHWPVKASLRTKHLSVTFVHSRKQAKQTPDGSTNTGLIPSKNSALQFLK